MEDVGWWGWRGLHRGLSRKSPREQFYADKERVALLFDTEATARKIAVGSLAHFTSAYVPLSKVAF